MLGLEGVSLIFRLCLMGSVVGFSAHLANDASADDFDCDALFEAVKAEAGGDPSRCTKPVVEYSSMPCEQPESYSDPRVPAQVVLALDASGSMAGATGNETKMAAAKRETIAFMQALEEDVPVGLVVYGHTGDNTENGKAVSCLGTEWAQDLGVDTDATIDHINSIEPTGWTPLADTLAFLEAELAAHTGVIANSQETENGEQQVPVVYLISDGEETCGGDPVAAAKSLSESGVQAIVNVIGFDVDAETRAQLEQISKAGSGRYLIANDARELRQQLEAEQRSRLAMSDYRGCLSKNLFTVGRAYDKAIISMQECFRSESVTNGLDPITEIMRRHSEQETPESACYLPIVRKAGDDFHEASQRESEIYDAMREEQDALLGEMQQP